jgi:RNA polymerase sigma factor for flagellar operon FliA
MLDQLRRTDWVPRAVHEKARRLQTRIAELEQRCGRLVTEDEIAAELQLSPRQYEDLLEEIRPATFVCLDAVCGNDGSEGSTYSDFVADPSEDNPFEQTCRAELKEIIFQRLKELPLKQQQVMALYYGEDLNLKEIAAAMNLTESRVCQIHAQAIVSIRAYLQRLESTCPTGAIRN